MTNSLPAEYFNGFGYPGHQVKLFSKANNHFQILLFNGSSVSFEPPEKDADNFKEWLLKHKARDVKERVI